MVRRADLIAVFSCCCCHSSARRKLYAITDEKKNVIDCTLETEAKDGKPALHIVTSDGWIIGHLEEDAAGWHAFAFTGWKDFGWRPIGDFKEKQDAINAVAAVTPPIP